MICIVEWFTVVWLGMYAAIAFRKIAAGNYSTILTVYPVHFVFCGIPLALDRIWGTPNYARFPGFALACSDYSTNLIYCIYVCLCPIVWQYFEKESKYSPKIKEPTTDRTTPAVTAVLYVAVFLPLILVFLSPEPDMYLQYTPFGRELRERAPAVAFVHMLVSKLCLLSLLAAAGLVATQRSLKATLVVVMPALFAVCWIHGKRNCVAFSLAVIVYALWRRGSLRGKRLATAGCMALLGFALFSHYYQRELRFSEEFVSRRSESFWYEWFRIDYGRDDVIKLAIFAELNPDMVQIQDYRGQSLLGLTQLFIPRYFLPEKEESHSTFVTRAVLGRDSLGGGGVTTSILEEPIANFGFAGLAVGPLLIALVCCVGDRSGLAVGRPLTVLILICMQVVHISPWAGLAVLWVFAMSIGGGVTGHKRGVRVSSQKQRANGAVPVGFPLTRKLLN